jgi:NADH:ubiquinone oxidoreductase subunit D
MTVYFYCFREREMILDMFDALCGARLTYSYLRVGGVVADANETSESLGRLPRYHRRAHREYDTCCRKTKFSPDAPKASAR